MGAWSRETPWRQGHVLTNESSVALGLVPAESVESSAAVVISHDCDLAQLPEGEPLVEVIVSQRIEKPDGNCTHAKNSRRLHLPCTASGTPACLDLRAQTKATIRKDDLAGHTPNAEVVIDPKEKNVLQRWLAVRYRRAAFPDEFVKRLNDTGVAKRIAKILEPLGKHMIAVFFDVDEGLEKVRNGETDLYQLRIDLLYSTDEDPAIAQAAAEKAAASITAAFRDRCFDSVAGWKWIELVGCEPIADQAMTFAQSTQLKQWNMDYLSLRGDSPAEPMLE
jgi:hypothetical protein